MNSFMMDIKNNSNDLHAVAEKTGFLKRLLEGKASPKATLNIFIIFTKFITQ